MTICVHIHKTHRPLTGGRDVVEVQGETVADCLGHLVRQHPAIEEVIFDKKGGVRRTIEIYLNMASAYPDELKKTVRPGDAIHLTVMLAGG